MKVSELARAAGVTPHVVRHYAQVGLLKPTRDSENNYKQFSESDVKRLRFIRKAQELGYALSEIREILDHADHGESPCPMVRAILERRIDETRRKVDELQRLQRRMEEALTQWCDMPDSLPNGHTVCHLIESS
uniref:DNA-binding transcriptional regulator, MerR family n=1 Tax=Candidatus Kentrum sp. DK TaxID=2126562 RepID=A0A450SIZ8_9GAMM|nr:MAG: DNA-binding transcriptional regulator, MerR family [Candidatus Kentron sp. DK]